MRVLVYISLFACSLGILVNDSAAQDTHFSMYDFTPLNINPAYTGHYEEDQRFIFNHRQQWQSVTEPYSTFSASYDQRLEVKREPMAAGVVINQDQAGDGQFSTFELGLNAAKKFGLGWDSTIVFGVGLQASLVNRSINMDALTFDRQFNGDIFDGSLPNGESLSSSGFMYFDLSIGGMGTYQINDQTTVQLGMTLKHLNKPKQSFYDNTIVNLHRRFIVDASATRFLTETVSVHPMILWMSQAKFREALAGVRAAKVLTDEVGSFTRVSAGAGVRIDDALIFRVGLDRNQWRFGLSYDFNTSDLQVASNKKGGFEFALVYLVTKVKPVNVSRKVCPVY